MALEGKFFTIIALAGLVLLVRKTAPKYLPFLYLAGLLILSGLWIERFEPGLTKVPCSFSYCFVSGGAAMLLLLWLHYLSGMVPGALVLKIFPGQEPIR